jgi:cobalt-zinc-cadmium resistance protein CzcA
MAHRLAPFWRPVEVGRPVVFAVGIIMIVYLPILTLIGIEGKMFRPMALTVVFALLGSLLLSLTYIPAALTFVLRGHMSEYETGIITWARRRYRPTLALVMRGFTLKLGLPAGRPAPPRPELPIRSGSMWIPSS